MTPTPLRVAVLIDLPWRAQAGGHVKTWERLARAAAVHAAGLQLDLHALGDAVAAVPLAANVRLFTHRAVWPTSRLRFLRVPDDTDLARHHRGLDRALVGYDVLHTTSAFFAFAGTAERVAASTGVPLVHSIHTDTPAYTRLYTEQTVERCVGRGRMRKLLLDGLGVAERAESRMRRRLVAHLRQCAFALANRPEDRATALNALGAARVGGLRRGVERDLFGAAARDREWLEATLGVPRDRVVVLFVGRVDAGKNVLELTAAIDELLQAEAPVHLLCVGDGPDRGAIAARLGDHATCPGFLRPDHLARVYAAADLLAHPSTIEVTSNVVLEALCAGLPVVASPEAGQPLLAVGAGGVVIAEGQRRGWPRTLADLIHDPARRARLAAEAASWSSAAIPSWGDVLERDLLPVWRGVAAGGRGEPA